MPANNTEQKLIDAVEETLEMLEARPIDAGELEVSEKLETALKEFCKVKEQPGPLKFVIRQSKRLDWYLARIDDPSTYTDNPNRARIFNSYNEARQSVFAIGEYIDEFDGATIHVKR